MTTQAEDLSKAITAAAEVWAAHVRLSSLEITTAIGKLTDALTKKPGSEVTNVFYPEPAGPHQTAQDAPGGPRMPGRKETPTEPLRDAQDATGREWVGALVIKDGDGKKWALDSDGIYRDLYPSGLGALLRPSVSIAEPVTVILDADGNPSHLRDMEQSRNEIAGTWATVCDHMDLAPDVTTGEFNTAVDALAERYHATGYQQGLKDSPTELADGNPPTAEPQHKRCGSEHPSNPTVIPCQLDAGHTGPHHSSTGCAGGARFWGPDDDVPPTPEPEPRLHSVDADVTWAHYRKTYQPNPSHMAAAHKAFHAGWDMATTELQWDNAPEPVWLDADELRDLPAKSLVIGGWVGGTPRVKTDGGLWRNTDNLRIEWPAEAIAPARVLWTPEADR